MAHPHLTAEQLENLKYLEGNFSLTPSFADLVNDMWNCISWYYDSRMWINYKFPDSWINEISRNFHFPAHQTFYIVYIAILITILRYAFERLVCKPLVNWLELTSTNKKKFPESVWKTLFYTCTWLFNFYLLNYRYNYFREPYLMWDDWVSGMYIPFDIKLMYFIQCGFYLHSVYGTIYMDYKRKDFYAMLIHHVLTMALIFVSYAIRCHKVGLLVLFTHDISDIWLELAKTTHYLSTRKGGREYPRWDACGKGCFIMFLSSWFLFRLYWYPLKVLYSTGVVTIYRAYERGCSGYGFFNSLLWTLFGLNIYWLYFIIQFLFRTLTMPFKKLQDTREGEDEDEEDITSTVGPTRSPHQTLPNEEKKKKN